MLKINLMALVSAVAFSTLANAVSEQDDPNIGNWTGSFQTRVGTLVHTPDRVSLGGISSRNLNVNARSFNGVVLSAPLSVNASMSREQVEAALRASGVL